MQTEISRFGRVGFSRFQQQQEVGLEASGQFLSKIEALVMLVPLARVSARSEMKLTTRHSGLWWKLLVPPSGATHSSTLGWKIPWIQEHGRLQSMGSQRVGHD